MILDLLHTDVKRLFLLRLIVGVDLLVLRRREALHLAQRRDDLARQDAVVSRRAQAVFVAARRLDDDVVAGFQRQAVRIKIIVFRIVAEPHVDDLDALRLLRLLQWFRDLHRFRLCGGLGLCRSFRCFFRGLHGFHLRRLHRFRSGLFRLGQLLPGVLDLFHGSLLSAAKRGSA